MPTQPDSFEKKSILFENGKSAQVFQLQQALDVERLKALDISAQAAIIVGGSTTPFQPRLKNRLTDLISRGVAQAALESKAILIDEGTNTGVSELVGQGVADRGRKTQLIGVLPPHKMTGRNEPVAEDAKNLDANHSHLLLNEEGQQVSQAEAMCCLAEAASE